MPKKNYGSMQVPPKWSAQDKRFAESLTEALGVLAGNRGDPLNRAVTVWDLIDSGIATLPKGSNFYNGDSGGIIPSPPIIPYLDTPPAPYNLEASGAFQNIILTWDLDLYIGHAFVEIYRNTSDNIAEASLVGTHSGIGVYSDSVGGGSSYYYWVRAVNQNGVAGAFNSSSGTLGETAIDPAYILAELENSITITQLADELSEPIQLIDADASVVGSVAHQVAQEALARGTALSAESTARAAAITSEASARAAAISASATALQNQVNDLLDITAYDNATAYVENDQVTYDDKLYRASQATTGNLPTNTTYWTLLGEYSSLGALAGSNVAAIKQINTISASSTSASALAINALNATVNDATTGVAATSTALDSVETLVNHTETGVAASASKIGVLEATVNNATTGVAATSLALDSVETLVNHSDTGVAASAEKIGFLETTVNDATTGVAATSLALDSVETLVNHSDTGVAASAEKIGFLETTVNNPTTGVSATAVALESVETLVNNSETGVTASSDKIGVLQTTLDGTNGDNGLAANFQSLSSSVTDSESGLSATAGKVSSLVATVGDANGGLVQSQNATADESEATADDITALIASLNTANGGSSTTLNAAIVAERAVRVGAESANGTLITGITSKVSNKTQTFAQDDIPTALAVGDLWIDTNDDNKLYRAKAIGADQVSSAEWVAVRDTSATTTFSQSTIPTSITVGDIWIDTSADGAGIINYRVYRAETVGADQITAGEWVLLDLGQALASASAITVLNTEVGIDGSGSASRIDNIESEFSNPETGTTTLAQNFTSVLSQVYPDGTGSASSLTGIVASITEKPDTFAQSTVPNSGAVGDMWIDTGNNNKLYRSASKLADQIAVGEWEAVNPETTTTFSQNTIPTSVTIGDIWIDTGLDVNGDVKNYFYRAESVGANEVTAGEWVLLDIGNAVQTASVVNLIEADVFPDGSSSASATTQISARLDNALGENTGVTLEEKFVANAETLGELSGQYTVKIDNNGHVAGFGLANVTVDGTTESAFVIRADKFAIVDPASTDDNLTNTPSSDAIPFGVTSGVVYIKSAAIQDGTIVNAKIADAAIDDAKIANLSATKLDAGTINTSLINIEGIGAGINLASASTGERMVIASQVIKVFDTAGTLRVKLGNLSA